MGEERESYRLRIFRSGQLRRELRLTGSAWTYTAADLATDIGNGFYTIEVAQISERFGAGLTTTIERFL